MENDIQREMFNLADRQDAMQLDRRFFFTFPTDKEQMAVTLFSPEPSSSLSEKSTGSSYAILRVVRPDMLGVSESSPRATLVIFTGKLVSMVVPSFEGATLRDL